MLPSLPRLSLLALALSACTSTADLPAESSSTEPQDTVYAVTLAPSPLEACTEPQAAEALRASLVDLRGERLLLLQLTTTPAVALRPPGACTSVSGACGHLQVDLFTTDDETEGPYHTLYTSAAIVELPLRSADQATVWVKLTLLDDAGRQGVDPVGQAVTTARRAIDVFAPGDPACVAPADGG